MCSRTLVSVSVTGFTSVSSRAAVSPTDNESLELFKASPADTDTLGHTPLTAHSSSGLVNQTKAELEGDLQMFG